MSSGALSVPRYALETEVAFCVQEVISPLLANVYLHYVLDQWTDQWRQTVFSDVTIVRYADDAIVGFQYEAAAKKYLARLRERLRQYGLELNEEKTRLIRFGRFAAHDRAERGEGKPESFTFLGFRHICAKTRKGSFEVRRITDGDRRRRKLQEIRQTLRKRMHDCVTQVGEWLRSLLLGYYQYHAVPGNIRVLTNFRHQVVRYWYRALCKRSQRPPSWQQLSPIFDHWLPSPRVVHPYPDARFDARRLAMSHPR